MRYTYRILTPFSRFQNLVNFARMLHSHRVLWHPLLDDDLPFGIHSIDWIDPVYVPRGEPPGFVRAHWMLNWFIEKAYVFESDRYLFLADDDWYEPGFFDKLDAVDGEVLICSMLRGHHQPPTGTPYGTSPLEAAPQNLHVGQVGAEQLVVSGKVLKPCRFGPEPHADGILIEALTSRHKPAFVPDAHVWFNYLEPGRWDKK